MKALKEKRISLRSLWRMGLVALSVFALAFTACGSSDGTPTGPTNPGGSANTAKVPIAFSVKTYPNTSSGPVFEGQPVDLSGLVLNVRYADNTVDEAVTDLRRVSIEPNVYITGHNVGSLVNPLDVTDAKTEWVPLTQYWLTYTENLQTIRIPISPSSLGQHQYLLDMEVTGHMTKDEYLIDEIPDFRGLTVNGVYSIGVGASGRWKPDMSHLLSTQNTYIRKEIPLDTKYPEHRWAWVWNAQLGTGSFSPNDNPGVLVSIGSFGQIFSKIKGDGTTEAGSYLDGERIQLAALYNIWKIEVDRAPSFSNPIFYDDPTLISAIPINKSGTTYTENNVNDFLKAVEVRQNRWIDKAFSDMTLKVTYLNNEAKSYTLPALKTMNPAVALDLLNYGYGGSWANLELYPITYRDNLVIDITRDTKERAVPSAEQRGFEIYDWIKNDNYDETETSLLGGGDPILVGDGGWSEWVEVNANRSAMRFFWRGKTVDVPVRIYNRPTKVEVTPRVGVTPSNPVLMNGYDYVYRRPEGMADFLSRFVVKVTYQVRGTTDEKAREDVIYDMNSGTCRTLVPYFGIGTNPATPDTYNGVPAATGYPTLYSSNIFNWKDDRDGTGDLAMALTRLIADESVTVGSDEAGYVIAVNESFLTQTNSDAYNSARARTQKGNITFVGFSGNPDTVRPVRVTYDTGVTGYPIDPPQTVNDL